MAYEKEISDYIESHKEEMLNDLMDMIRINSEKGEEKPGMPYGEGPYKAIQSASKLLEGYGFKITNYDNRVITADSFDLPNQLDILAHLDVVPAGDDWTVTEPYNPVIKEGLLYGRGSCDDKGPAIAAVYAVRAVKELGIPLKQGVRLILGSDEECGSSDVEYYYSKEKAAPMTITPDASWPLINIEKGGIHNEFTVSFEKTDMTPSVVSVKGGIKINVVPGKATAVVKGLKEKDVRDITNKFEEETGLKFVFAEDGDNLNITAIGVNAHASLPHMGKNAVQGIVTLLSKFPLADAPVNNYIKALNNIFPYGDYNGRTMGVDLKDDVSGETTVSFDILEVSETHFMGAFDCRASIVANDENTGKVMEAKIREQGFKIEEKAMFEPHIVDGDSPLVKTLLGCYEKGFGVTGAKPIAIGGGTYVHHVENGVAFGCEVPEVDNHMHGADEFMEVDMIIKSAKIFADAIVELCG
ncbi:MAG: Sapep family Mn(2+)-dependent dipeptidase [Catonella sp.]|uniref:Sapep family Mn(2+)-dependent dipeptidase n=1 Tax=Catonella sp. TaxID=2382125 RepID=UPI003F9F4723